MISLPKVVRSIGWVSGSYLIAYVLRFVQAIIIARWLGPTEMGLFAYAYAIMSVLEVLAKIGADQVFITRSPSDASERDWLNGCWTMRLIMSLFISALLYGASILLPNGEGRMGQLLMTIMAIPPLMAMRSARLIQMQKHQQFNILSKFEIGAAIVRTVLPVIVVYFNRSVEWLVTVNVIAVGVNTALSYFLYPFRPKLGLTKEIAHELYFYGRNNIAISALTVAHNTLDNIAVGTYVGKASLGIYSTGYRLAITPFTFIQSVAIRVLTPQYRCAFDKGLAALIDHWRVAFRFLVLANAAIMGAFILMVDVGVDFIFGEAWADMGYVIVISSFTAFFRGAALAISPILTVTRAPHIDARMKFAEVGLFCVFILVGSFVHSITIFLVGGVVSYAAAYLMRAYWWHRYVERSGVKLGVEELVATGQAFSLLCTAVICRNLGADLRITLPLFIAVLGLFLWRRARNVVKEFES